MKTGPEVAIAAMEKESLALHLAGEGNDPAQVIAYLQEQALQDGIVGEPLYSS